ncbi:MAG: type II toxin-antitoxin system VapC family toxin [Caldilineaceae bacterium]|nr:type II toxin-antitoxin system VapC family toxin [Caldilineaceae bacterium]
MDTNIISDLVRHPTGVIFQRIVQVGEESICTSIVVLCELRYGAQKSGSTRLQHQLEQILARMTVIPLQPPVDARYGEIRTHLERLGTPIGPNDLLIAAHALTLNLTLVTANVDEFSRVPNLALVDWLA